MCGTSFDSLQCIIFRFHTTFLCWGGDLEYKFSKVFSESKMREGIFPNVYDYFLSSFPMLFFCAFYILANLWVDGKIHMLRMKGKSPISCWLFMLEKRGGKGNQKQTECSFHLNYKNWVWDCFTIHMLFWVSKEIMWHRFS